MSSVIASIKPTIASPQRIVGEVTKDAKTGFLHVQYKEPGKIKATPLAFDPADLIAHKLGAAGFVVAMTTNAIATLVGELVTKNDRTFLKTADGNVELTKLPGVSIEYAPVDPESREARSAEKASAIKVRGARAAAKADAPAKKSASGGSSRAERRAAAKAAAGEKAAPAKSKKLGRTEAAEGVVKKKKRRAA